MGDRYVVGFRTNEKDKTPVWLYSHYGGKNSGQLVARAVEVARERWSDPSYATRIAISMIVGENWGDSTGFGISAGDYNSYSEPNADEVLIVNWEDQTVSVVESRSDNVLVNYGFDVFLSVFKQPARV